MRLEEFKNYCVSRGFTINENSLSKSYPLPKKEDEDKPLEIKLEYVIERPWIKGFRIDSLGRKVLISKAKIKSVTVDESGSLSGFMRRQIEGDKYTWIS